MRAFYVHQRFPQLTWQVVVLEEEQARRFLELKTPHVYLTLAQAFAVRDELNRKRNAQAELNF